MPIPPAAPLISTAPLLTRAILDGPGLLHGARVADPDLLALDPPGDDSLGMDPDQRLISLKGLRPAADLDPTRHPGVRARQVIDHDRRTAAPASIPELLGALEVHAADIDRVVGGVVGPADGDDVRRPVFADRRDPAEPLRPLLAQILEFMSSEDAHRFPPAVVTSLNCVLRATTPRSTSLNWAYVFAPTSLA